MEWTVFIALIVPALLLAARRSSLLMDYAIWSFALNRGIRRVVDYYFNGHFNPLSPISLVPLVVGGVLFMLGMTKLHNLTGRSRRIVTLFLGAVSVGFVVGLIHAGFAAIYSLGEWVAGLGAMVFSATHLEGVRVGDRWLKTAGWAGMFVAAYGWWQYYTIPPWDGSWLVQSGMAGYMGVPEPTQMTCFSTLHERGPCAGFLGWAVIPMILSRCWRNPFGWLSVLLILSAMMLTQVRSMFIVVGLVALLHPLLTRGQGALRILLLAGTVTLVANYAIEKLPDSQKFTKRFESESLIGEGSSLQGRFEIYQVGLRDVATNPLGYGLGSSGLAQRVASGEITTIGDAGYVQILNQFGWTGGVMFFAALVLLWREASQRLVLAHAWLPPAGLDAFTASARSILLAMLVLLFIADVFAGFSLMWIIFGRALHPLADPHLVRIFLERRAKQSVSNSVKSVKRESTSA